MLIENVFRSYIFTYYENVMNFIHLNDQAFLKACPFAAKKKKTQVRLKAKIKVLMTDLWCDKYNNSRDFFIPLNSV